MTYSEADLDEMVTNFEKFGDKGMKLLTPVAVLGHEEDQRFLDELAKNTNDRILDSDNISVSATDIPAAGVPTRVWREGHKLFADFADMPQPVAELIAAKAYRKCSIEHYDKDRPFDAGNGKVFTDKILRRIAFLGGEIPQVKTLADLPVPVFSYGDKKRIAVYRTTGGACFAFSETAVTKFELVTKLRTSKRFARCFADPPATGGDATIDTAMLKERIQAALVGVDAATLDGLSDMQLMGLALGCPPVVDAGSGGGGTDTSNLADYPDRATMIQELVAGGEDATMLEGLTDTDLQAKYAAKAGKQFKEKTPVVTPTETPAAIVKAFAEQKAALDVQLAESKRINAEMQAANKRAQEKLAAARETEVHAFVDQLVKDAKIVPAQKPTIIRNLLKANDSDPCHSFAEGGKEVKVTEYERDKREMAAWPADPHRFGEKIRGGGTGSTDEAIELAKVQAFADANAAALKAAGKTPASFCHSFAEARKKDPSLTASKFGVPAEYCA